MTLMLLLLLLLFMLTLLHLNSHCRDELIRAASAEALASILGAAGGCGSEGALSAGDVERAVRVLEEFDKKVALPAFCVFVFTLILAQQRAPPPPPLSKSQQNRPGAAGGSKPAPAAATPRAMTASEQLQVRHCSASCSVFACNISHPQFVLCIELNFPPSSLPSFT
jgi:hypothetical protein